MCVGPGEFPGPFRYVWVGVMISEEAFRADVYGLVKRDLIQKLTAEGLKREAEELMFKNGDNTSMYGGSGVIDHILGMKVLPYGLDRDGTLEVVAGVREHFEIPVGWVPPSIVLRDALPHMVHLRRVLLPLTGGNIARREELVGRLGRLAREFETPDEAAAVGLEWLRSMVGVLTEGLSRSVC